MDPAQYGNQRGVSVQHYLIKMIHRILTVLDNNSKKETFAVIANLIDWNNAFPRQCPKLGIESFVNNGVRPSLIPVLVNYFQNREMTVKWHGVKSDVRDLPGGSPQGASLGVWSFLSQTNDNPEDASDDEIYKFVDDKSVIEIINLFKSISTVLFKMVRNNCNTIDNYDN